MKSYRLVIEHQGRPVGHFETAGSQALEDVIVARALFGVTGGYQCELWESDSERRILESGPEGMKVISRDKCYKPAKFDL
jgi:hypothetical protein